MSDLEVAPRRSQRGDRPAKGDLRERALIEVANRLLAAGTFDRASVAELAEAAGISRAGFYFYFASKQALLASVVDAALAGLSTEIAAVLTPEQPLEPVEAVRATVQAAASLWWDQREVMVASFELGVTVREVYERSMQNFAAVRTPTVSLLRQIGTVPEARDEADATRLVTTLMLMSERSFYDLMRAEPTAEEREELVARLTRIWSRAFGVER